MSGKRPTKRRIRPLRSAVLAFLQAVFEMTRDEVAQATGLKKETIGYLEQGKKEPRLATLERLVTRMKVSKALLSDLLDLAAEMRGRRVEDRWVGPILVPAVRIQGIRELARQFGRFMRERYNDWLLRDLVETQVQEDRESARQIGVYLRGKKDLVQLVRADEGCHLWSVAEWLCEESIQVISRDREQAGRLAEAALVVAELAPGGERFRKRLEASCWGHFGNVRRVGGGYDSAGDVFAKCAELWRAGAGGDPHHLLDEGRVLGMEASLRRDQGRFTEALRLLRQALQVALARERPYLHLNYGFVLEQIGDYEDAIRALREAEQDAPRHLRVHVRFNLGVNFCHLGQYEAAEDLLPEIARLAVESESKEHQTRVRWLAGRVAAGFGRIEEALGSFRRVQGEFIELGNTYDAALVSLELAKIYLERGETGSVKRLAREMAPVFVDVGVHHHAQEALSFFQAAAEQEAASVEMVARIILYLQRARCSPGLRFEGMAALGRR